MKRIGQIIGAAIVGIVCMGLLPIIIPIIVLYTIFAVIKAFFVAIMAATVIKAKGDSL